MVRNYLKKAIMTYATADANAYTTALGGRIYYLSAPEDVVAPYAVFEIVQGSDYDLLGGSDGQNYNLEVLVMFRHFDVTPTDNSRSAATNVDTIADLCISRFKEKLDISIDGDWTIYNVMVHLQRATSYELTDQEIFTNQIIFKFYLEKE